MAAELGGEIGEIALTGHTRTHAAWSSQVSESIRNRPGPSMIEPVGHSARHAPQRVHAALMMYAIVEQDTVAL